MEFSKIAFVDFVEEFLWRNGGIGIIITRPSFSLSLSLSQMRGNPIERQTKHTQQQKVHDVCVCSWRVCLFVESAAVCSRALRAAERRGAPGNYTRVCGMENYAN
jgi:hypothetical protein